MDQTETNKRVIRRFIEEVVNTGDTTAIADLVAEDCVETDGKVRVVSGVDGMAGHVEAVRSIYKDLVVEIQRQVAEGEWVASAVIARGTHSGEWLGMEPTGEQLEFTGVNLDRVVDGKIVEHGGAANMLQPFLEAGSLKPS